MQCRSCGAEGEPIEIEMNGETVASGSLCGPCFEQAKEGAAKLREEFDQLLAAGVSRKDANDLLIARMESERAS